MTRRVPAAWLTALAFLFGLVSNGRAAECGSRASNGAVPGTLAAGPGAPCTPAANPRPLVGQPAPAAPADPARPRERSKTTVHLGGSLGTDTRVGR